MAVQKAGTSGLGVETLLPIQIKVHEGAIGVDWLHNIAQLFL